jgi:hypothetical protein
VYEHAHATAEKIRENKGDKGDKRMSSSEMLNSDDQQARNKKSSDRRVE